MDTGERLNKYRKLNETKQEEFLAEHSHDERFVELVGLGNKLMTGFLEALEKETK